MPKLVSVSDDLHQTLKNNEDYIKGNYLTLKYFIDSAIREKLRRNNIDVGDDEIIAHLERLKASKARHINQQALIRKRKNHTRRVTRQQDKLNTVTEE